MEHVVTPSEEKKGFDYEGFVKKWLWLVAIVFAAIVFIGLAFPQFEANAIEVTGGPIVVDGETTSGYIFTALDEVEYGFGALFANGGNWMVLWLYFLPLISLTSSSFRRPSSLTANAGKPSVTTLPSIGATRALSI